MNEAPTCHASGADVRLTEFDPAHLRELVLMWRASFEAGVGIEDPHPLEAQERYFLDELLSHHSVCVATSGDEVVAFVAANKESIAQLYVRVCWWRRGIGARMLEWAKAQSGGSLWLYTFARNAAARAFYEHHGFVVEAHGYEPTWQLEDVRYRWVAAEPRRD